MKEKIFGVLVMTGIAVGVTALWYHKIGPAISKASADATKAGE